MLIYSYCCLAEFHPTSLWNSLWAKMHNLTLYGLFQSCEIIWMLIKISYFKIRTLWSAEGGWRCLMIKTLNWNLTFDKFAKAVTVGCYSQKIIYCVTARRCWRCKLSLDWILSFTVVRNHIVAILLKFWNSPSTSRACNFLRNHNAPFATCEDLRGEREHKLIGWTIINFWLTKNQTWVMPRRH